MKKFGVTKGLTSSVFVAVNVDETNQVIELATYGQSRAITQKAWEFGAPFCLAPDGSKALQLRSTLRVDYANLDKLLSPKEIAPYNNIYFPLAESGVIGRPYNKMMVSYDSKDGGANHLQRIDYSCMGQLLVPFPDSSFADCGLRITVNESIGYWLSFEAEEVTNEASSFHDFSKAIMPTITADLTEEPVAANDVAEVVFRVAPAKEGVKIYLRTPAGYLPKTELLTDDEGKVTAKVAALHLDSGDSFDMEAGFKWVSNIARTRVEVI